MTCAVGWTIVLDHAEHFRLHAVALSSPGIATHLARAEVSHTFTASDADWGFSQMANIREIEDPNNGFLVNGMVQASAPCSLRETGSLAARPWWHSSASHHTCLDGQVAVLVLWRARAQAGLVQEVQREHTKFLSLEL